MKHEELKDALEVALSITYGAANVEDINQADNWIQRIYLRIDEALDILAEEESA